MRAEPKLEKHVAHPPPLCFREVLPPKDDTYWAAHMRRTSHHENYLSYYMLWFVNFYPFLLLRSEVHVSALTFLILPRALLLLWGQPFTLISTPLLVPSNLTSWLNYGRSKLSADVEWDLQRRNQGAFKVKEFLDFFWPLTYVMLVAAINGGQVAIIWYHVWVTST